MPETTTKAEKIINIDDALRHMHINHGGYGRSHSSKSIANFIGIKVSRVEDIESKAIRKVRKLIKEKYIHEYDHD